MGNKVMLFLILLCFDQQLVFCLHQVMDQPTSCRAQGEWLCHDGLLCISNKWVCDGYIDCYDQSDELNCPSTTTTTSTTTRTTASTTTSTTTATPTTPTKPRRTTFKATATTSGQNPGCSGTDVSCAADGSCLPKEAVCNGFTDCSDRSDEVGCTPTARSTSISSPSSTPQSPSTLSTTSNTFWSISSPQTTTYSKTTTPTTITTTTTTTTTTSPTTTTASTTTRTATSPTTAATRTSATTTKSTSFVTSATATSTVTWAWTSNECPVNRFNCSSGGQCVQASYNCDGFQDCVDGSDEINCRTAQSNNVSSYIVIARPANTMGSSYCYSGQFQCNSTVTNGNPTQTKKCIPLGWVCDGQDDCGDASDETNCQNCQKMPAVRSFNCLTGGQCVSLAVRCNGRNDCQDGSDEVACWCDQQRSKVKCNATSCVHVRLWCDGHSDCSNNADELFCGDELCPSGSFRCDAIANQ